MTYSISKLTTKAECDQVLTYAANEKRTLEYRQTTSVYSQGNTASSTDKVTAAITSTQAELGGIEAALSTITDADTRRVYERKKTKLQNKLDDLGFRKEDVGGPRLLINELEAGQVEVQLAETNAFIAAVTAHKDTLPS